MAQESPRYGTRSPSSVGFMNVRIELFGDDPITVQTRALAAGAVEHSPVNEHTHHTSGPVPIKQMLQGAVVDPYGHMWLIGKILESRRQQLRNMILQCADSIDADADPVGAGQREIILGDDAGSGHQKYPSRKATFAEKAMD